MDSSASESAFEQAKKYGEDLVKLYAIEKAKRVNLQLSNQKLQAIFSTTPNGLAVLNDNLIIEEANPAFWSLVEQEETNAATPISEVLPFPNLLEQLKTDIPSHESQVRKIEIDVPLTPMLWRTLLITTVPLSAGNKREWILSVHDLSEQKRLENLKSEFIHIAAHELRTPLAVILGFSQIVQETLPDNQNVASHLIDSILESSNRLKGIIDELIEFANVQYQTKSPQNTDSFDIVALLLNIIEATRHTAAEKQITIEPVFDVPLFEFSGNKNILEEAFRHIIENAIIYNKQAGRIIVRFANKSDHILIEVEDTGIGIAQKELPKIFDKFYQVEEPLTRSVGGLGLGLAISQRGILLHQGVINVRSKLNEGSCFSISLPKTIVSEAQDSELDIKGSYAQTLAFGKDLAKAVSAERASAKKLQSYEKYRLQLLDALQNNFPVEQLLTIVQQMGVE